MGDKRLKNDIKIGDKFWFWTVIGESNTPIDKVCPVCGNNFQGLREIYCSPECSRRARERAVKENSKQYYLDHKKGSQ